MGIVSGTEVCLLLEDLYRRLVREIPCLQNSRGFNIVLGSGFI